MDQETIICAAILTREGQVIRGHRHHHCIAAATSMGLHAGGYGEDSQGFITSKGRYVGRREARRLQEAAGIDSVAPGGYRADLLFSEDVY